MCVSCKNVLELNVYSADLVLNQSTYFTVNLCYCSYNIVKQGYTAPVRQEVRMITYYC